jgi:hypothetical protein
MAEERRDADGYPEDPRLRTQEKRLEQMLSDLPRVPAPSTLRAEVMAELRATPPGLMTRLRRRWARLGSWRMPIQLAPAAALVLVAVIGHRMLVLGPGERAEAPSFAATPREGLDGAQFAAVPEMDRLNRMTQEGDVQESVERGLALPANEVAAGLLRQSPVDDTDFAEMDKRDVRTGPTEAVAGEILAVTETEAEALGVVSEGLRSGVAGTYRAPVTPGPKDLAEPSVEVAALMDEESEVRAGTSTLRYDELGREATDLAATGPIVAFAEPAPASVPLAAHEVMPGERFWGLEPEEEEAQAARQIADAREATVAEPEPQPPSTAMRITTQRVEIEEIPGQELAQSRTLRGEQVAPSALSFNGRTGITADEMRARRGRIAVVPAPPEESRREEERTRLSVSTGDPEALIERLAEVIREYDGLVTVRQPVTRDRNIWRVVAELPRYRIEALREELPHLADPAGVPAPDLPAAPRQLSPADRERVPVEIMIDRR